MEFFEVFVDTIVICTMTALVILCSGVSIGYGEAAGAELTINGFTSTYGNWVLFLPQLPCVVLHFPQSLDGAYMEQDVLNFCLVQKSINHLWYFIRW